MIARAWRWVRSIVFTVTIFTTMAVMAVFFTPWALVDRGGAFAGIRTWCRFVRWLAAWWLGLRTEVRGTVPAGEVMIAAKHQSFLDIIVICSVVPRPKFIMKQELRRAPILGWYALRIGCVPVDRGKRGKAIAQMLADVAAGRAEPGQLIIYPQGTRIAPGVAAPYKIGTGALYAATGQPCVPAATNVGVFWPRRGLMRRSGLGVVEFLPEIPAGMRPEAFMEALETRVEAASNALVSEARSQAD